MAAACQLGNDEEGACAWKRGGGPISGSYFRECTVEKKIVSHDIKQFTVFFPATIIVQHACCEWTFNDSS